MAWAQVGTGTSATITAGAGNQSVSLPGTPKIGDLVIVAVAGDISCANSVQSSGYTSPENGTGANPGAHFSYKVLTTAETAVLIARDATVLKSCVVQVWSGGNATSIVDAAWGGAGSGTSANPDSAAITVVGTNSLVVQVAFLDDDDTTVSNYPSGYSNGISANTGQSSTTVGSTVAVCSLVRSAGSENAGQWTMGSSDAWQANAISFALQQPISITQVVGALALTGYAPAVNVPVSLTPTVGAAAITGYAPAVTQQLQRAPTVGAVAITGYAPAVQATTHVQSAPTVGALGITGYAPAVTQQVQRAPTVGALALTGYAPSVTVIGINSWAVRGYEGHNAWAERYARGTSQFVPTAGALAVTGYAPAVTAGGADVPLYPVAGALAVTGYAPTRIEESFRYPAVGALTLTGYSPSVTQQVLLAPPVAALTLTGYVPSLNVSYSFGLVAGALALTGYAPSVQVQDQNSPSAYPQPGALTLTGYAPAVFEAVLRYPTAGAVSFAGYAPSVLQAITLMPTTGQLGVTGFAPARQVAGNVTLTVQTGQLGVTGQIPAVQYTATVVVTFPFASTAQGFTGTPGAGTTMAWTGANGNPAGSLSTRTTGSNRNVTNTWTLTTDWATLGIPANTVISAITAASAQSRITEYTGGNGGSVSAVTLTPTGLSGIQIAPSRTITGIEGSWTTSNGTGSSGLQIPSGASLAITAGSNLRTTSGGSGKAVTLLQDNLTFTVTYSAAKLLNVGAPIVGITGYAPTVSIAIAVHSWVRRLTDGKNTWALRSGMGPGEQFTPAVGALALAGYAPAVALGNPTRTVESGQLGITGYAPSILGNPITIAGADYLYSEPATVSSSGTHVIGQGDKIANVPARTLALTGYAPTVNVSYRIDQIRADLALTGYAPEVLRDYTIEVPSGALSVMGYDPYLSAPRVFTVTTAQLGVTGYAPSWIVPETPIIAAAVGEASITGYAPTVLVSERFTPAATTLGITGYAPSFETTALKIPQPSELGLTGYAPAVIQAGTFAVTAGVTSGLATVAGSGFITRHATGALQSLQPLLFGGEGFKTVHGTGSLQSGPATLHGNAYPVSGMLEAQPARVYGRGRVIGFEPSMRRRRPERVNRYTVVLKPKPRYRIRRPNHRRPDK